MKKFLSKTKEFCAKFVDEIILTVGIILGGLAVMICKEG